MGKTLYFHNCNDYSGSTRVLADILRRREGGGPVTVVTRNDEGKGFLSGLPDVRIVNSYLRPTVSGHRIFIVSELISRVYGFLVALREGKGFDTFYINTIMPCHAALAGRFAGKRIIYHVHEAFVTDKPSTRRAERIFMHTKAERIFVSEYVRSCYPDNGCRSTVQYNTLSREFSDKIEITPVGERSLSRVLMICALTKAKGADKFAALASLLPQYIFTLVCSADEKEIEEFFSDGIPANLTVMPTQPSVHRFLKESDLLLSLSDPKLWVETFGMTILEAMAYGLPVIVPSVGGPVELTGNAGYRMDVTDIKAVGDKIDELFRDRDLYSKISEECLSRAESFKER